ncbi:MAG: CoA ester lyase [Sphingomonadaceae bacterium]
MKIIRSFLFIPGDSEKKLAKADAAGADAIILDLEDSVAPAKKQDAREKTHLFLTDRPRSQHGFQIWVRINPLDSDLALGDLAAIVPAAPDGIMIPKPEGPADVQRLSHYLDALEVQAGLEPRAIKIVPVASETPGSVFRLGDYAGAGLDRLEAITWGAEDLSAALGASTNLDASGDWASTYKMTRSLVLLAAHAAGVQAIDTLYVDFRNEDGLRASCRAARSEGFTGRLAIHPAQVPIINECFSPSVEEVDHAKRVLAAFAANPDAGTVGLDGKMIDIPHLKQATRVLAQAGLAPSA